MSEPQVIDIRDASGSLPMAPGCHASKIGLIWASTKLTVASVTAIANAILARGVSLREVMRVEVYADNRYASGVRINVVTFRDRGIPIPPIPATTEEPAE